MNNLINLSASEMSRGIKSGEFTSEQLIQAHLDQINKCNNKINAIVTPCKNVLERAKEADKALKNGKDWGILHGVPITVKDSWATSGVRTTSSFRRLKKYIPEKDAIIVKKILDAGAIILGKTNVPMLASDIQCNSPIFGRSNNPWDISRTTGGSTGGGAAAVSGRLSPIELGSDLAGSIRIPAHFCGIMGFKPTEGALSIEGHVPPLPEKPVTVKHQAHAGLLARTVDDLKMVFECIGGSTKQLEEKKINQYKVAWLDFFDDAPLNKDTQQVFGEFIQLLNKSIPNLTKTKPKEINFQEIWKTFGHIFGYETGKGMPWFIRLISKLSYRKKKHPMYKGLLGGLGQNNIEYKNHLEEREKIIEQFNDFFKEYDIWVCPVVSQQAFTHIKTGKDIDIDGTLHTYWPASVSYTVVFNVTGMPVIVLPIGFATDGLPIGVQLVANLGKDQKLLTFAKEIEKILPKVKYPKELALTAN